MGNCWKGVCDECDVELNKIVLKFMNVKDWKLKIAKYKG